MLLARAFDRAWNNYYVPSRRGAISEEIARPSLGKHLVAMAKESVKDEGALAAGGLLHLISLTPEILDEARRPLLGVTSRFATAIGISAIVAFVFLVLVPKSQNGDATELAVSEHRTLSPAGAAEVTPEESQSLLEKFVQWHQRQ